MQYSTKKSSWSFRTLLTLFAILFALSFIVSVSSQDSSIRSRFKARFRPKKRIEESEAAAALAEASEIDKSADEGIVGNVAERRSSLARQLRTRNRIRSRRPTVVTPEPSSLFDEDEVERILIGYSVIKFVSLSFFKV